MSQASDSSPVPDPQEKHTPHASPSPTPAPRSGVAPVRVLESLHQNSGPVPPVAPPSSPAAPGSFPVPIPVHGPVPISDAPMSVDLDPHFGPAPFIAPPPDTENIKRPGAIARYWRAIGGGSLLVSLIIHGGILVAAYFIVQTITEEKPLDFLPGGGSKSGQEASSEFSKQVKAKKRTNLDKATPMQRIVSISNSSNVALPDVPMDNLDVPDLASTLSNGGQMSGGFGSSGAGGGFGSGMGIGGLSGVTFKPISMFGKNLKARRIGVIMDVSGSMTPHLTKVVKELDRVANGSPLILYVGCGVSSPAKGVKLDGDAMETLGRKDKVEAFEKFWRASHNAPPKPPVPGAPPEPPKKKKDKDEVEPVPEAAVYEVLANRRQTFFVKSQGIQYAWLALLVDELRHVDALYWFSDFQDAVDDKQIERVSDMMRRRKQKLFIHPSVKGKSFEEVRDKLCLPSGGEVVEVPEEKKKKTETKPAK